MRSMENIDYMPPPQVHTYRRVVLKCEVEAQRERPRLRGLVTPPTELRDRIGDRLSTALVWSLRPQLTYAPDICSILSYEIHSKGG